MRRRLLLVPLLALHNAPSGHPVATITWSAPVLVSNWSDSADSQPAGPSGVSPATFYGLSETTFVGNENNVNSLWSYSTDAGATWAHVVHPGGFVAGCCPVAAVPLRPAAAPSPFFAGGFHDMGVGRLSSDTPFKTQRRHPLSFEQTAAGALNMTQDKSDDVPPEITFSGIPYPGVNTSAEWGPPVAFGVLHVAPGKLVALTQVIWNGDPVIKGADGLQQPTSLLAFQSSDGYHWKFASVISNASWVRAPPAVTHSRTGKIRLQSQYHAVRGVPLAEPRQHGTERERPGTAERQPHDYGCHPPRRGCSLLDRHLPLVQPGVFDRQWWELDTAVANDRDGLRAAAAQAPPRRAAAALRVRSNPR